MANTLAELFGKDIVEDCRNAVQQRGVNSYRKRISAELILNDGSRRYYRCKSLLQKEATHEVLAFVEAIEKATGNRVVWRFKGADTYHMGTNTPVVVSKQKKEGIVKRFLDYFFDLED